MPESTKICKFRIQSEKNFLATVSYSESFDGEAGLGAVCKSYFPASKLQLKAFFTRYCRQPTHIYRYTNYNGVILLYLDENWLGSRYNTFFLNFLRVSPSPRLDTHLKLSSSSLVNPSRIPQSPSPPGSAMGTSFLGTSSYR